MNTNKFNEYWFKSYLVEEVKHEVPVHKVFEIYIRFAVSQSNKHVFQ